MTIANVTIYRDGVLTRTIAVSLLDAMLVGLNVEDWGGFAGVGGKTIGQDVASGGFVHVRWDAGNAVSDLVTYYVRQGLRPLVCFPGGTSTTWGYLTNGVSAIDASAWAAAALAYYQAHFTPAVAPAVEILNEPYGTWFWGTGADSAANAAAYGRLVKATGRAFRQALGNASPKILAATFANGATPGSPVGTPDPAHWWANLSAAVPDIASYYDGVVIHAYGGSNGTATGSLGNRSAVTSAHLATGKSVWVTEVGWPTDVANVSDPGWTEIQQAQNLSGFVSWARGTSYVAAVYVYAYLDDSAPAWFGLTRHGEGGATTDWTHKPSWAALQGVRS